MTENRIIEADEVRRRLAAGEKLTIIDVREDDEVAMGMIPGARHIPMGSVPDRLGEIPKEGEVILVCRSGHRSGQVCDYLASLGYRNVKNMIGGMIAWEGKG